MSNTGHLAPNYYLTLLGETPASFFGSYMYTYNHDSSVLAVADNLVNGAAIDSLVYDQMIDANPELADKTKIIDRWGPYGIPPVVFHPAMDLKLKQELQEIFLNLHIFNEGAVVLDDLGIDKFVIVPDNIYDSIRDMRRQQEQ
jgi:phosphonate transport system substrate-binding protein